MRQPRVQTKNFTSQCIHDNQQLMIHPPHMLSVDFVRPWCQKARFTFIWTQSSRCGAYTKTVKSTAYFAYIKVFVSEYQCHPHTAVKDIASLDAASCKSCTSLMFVPQTLIHSIHIHIYTDPKLWSSPDHTIFACEIQCISIFMYS